jgi:RES domain-containing protein
LLRISLDTIDLPAVESTVGSLPVNWRENLKWTRRIGDLWTQEKSSLALSVPSPILPESRWILLNPSHPKFESQVSTQIVEFDWNHPLFKHT